MHLAKKYLLSSVFIFSLGILQLSTFFLVKPVLADSSLLNNQQLLQESTASNYGNKPQDVKVIAFNILRLLLSFVGIILLVMLMIAGFKYMTAGGNEAQIKEAVSQIKALFIGLLIILASWSIVSYMVKWLICSTTTSGVSCSSIW